MKVEELVEKLKDMPQNADVYHLWDGELRTEINVVYVSRDGKAVTSDFDMFCYSTESRPKDAPTKEKNRYWKTQGELK